MSKICAANQAIFLRKARSIAGLEAVSAAADTSNYNRYRRNQKSYGKLKEPTGVSFYRFKLPVF